MSASTQTPAPAAERRRWLAQAPVPEMWASIAISVMWLAVLFDALYGPDLVVSDVSGSSTTIPSAIIVAFFAYLGTRVVARYGFPRTGGDDGS